MQKANMREKTTTKIPKANKTVNDNIQIGIQQSR